MNELEHSTGVTNPLLLLETAITKGIDPERLGKLLDLQERWERNRAAEAYAEAIRAFQTKMPPIVKEREVKNKDGLHMYNFAGFDDVMAVAQPILNECGITVTFTHKTAGPQLETICHVRVGMHVEDTSVTLSLPAIPNANDAQRAGGALSYGKRYAFCSALNIRVKNEDNDAQGLDPGLDGDQVKVINDLLDDCRAAGVPVDKARFYAWLQCNDLNDMRAADFAKAVDFLLRKKRPTKGS